MTRPDATTSPASRRLAYLFKHAERRMAELHAEVLTPLGIDARELGVLLAIERFAPASQQQVAERLGIDRTSMVARVDALEAKGILARRPDAADRRRNVVELTPTGRDLLGRATVASDAAEAELLGPLGPEEGEQLRELLVRLLIRTADGDG